MGVFAIGAKGRKSIVFHGLDKKLDYHFYEENFPFWKYQDNNSISQI